MKNLELTQEELTLIKLKRKEEEIKKQKEQLEKDKELVEATQSVKLKIKRIQESGEEQVKATTEFFKSFGDDWVLSVLESEEVCDEKKYVGGNFVTIYEETFSRKKAEICHSDYQMAVQVRMYTQTKGSSWNSRQVNVGYRMFLTGNGVPYNMENRAIARPETIIKNANNIIYAHKREKAAKVKNVNDQESIFRLLGEKYPGSTLVKEEGWVRNSYGKPGGHNVKVVKATFPNGVKIKFRVHSEHYYSIMEKEIGRGINMVDLLYNAVRKEEGK